MSGAAGDEPVHGRAARQVADADLRRREPLHGSVGLAALERARVARGLGVRVRAARARDDEERAARWAAAHRADAQVAGVVRWSAPLVGGPALGAGPVASTRGV